MLSIAFLSVAIIPAGAHLAEMPNKLQLSRDEYFVVQQIHAGWNLFGIVLLGSLLCTLVYAAILRRRNQPFGFAAAALGLVVANLAIFSMWTFPGNQATRNWTVIRENWEALRARWEYSHALNALVILTAFACVLVAAARDTATRSGSSRAIRDRTA